MIYDQREAEPVPTARDADGSERENRPLWRPPDSPVAADAADAPGDPELAAARYAAVDRIDGDVVTIAIAPWPRVDPASGRLDFGPAGDRRTTTVSAAALGARVDADRRGDAERGVPGQLVRPLRVGDVFAVVGLSGAVGRWGRIRDVTRAGRLAAKAALFSTVAPAPLPDRIADYGLAPEHAAPLPAAPTPAADAGEEAPPPGPVAYPAV